jgi:hypothetical protein
MKSKKQKSKRGLFARLFRCTEGGGNAVVVGIVATGIAVSAAALYGARTQAAVGNGATTIGARANQGAAGYVAGQ